MVWSWNELIGQIHSCIMRKWLWLSSSDFDENLICFDIHVIRSTRQEWSPFDSQSLLNIYPLLKKNWWSHRIDCTYRINVRSHPKDGLALANRVLTRLMTECSDFVLNYSIFIEEYLQVMMAFCDHAMLLGFRDA